MRIRRSGDSTESFSLKFLNKNAWKSFELMVRTALVISITNHWKFTKCTQEIVEDLWNWKRKRLIKLHVRREAFRWRMTVRQMMVKMLINYSDDIPKIRKQHTRMINRIAGDAGNDSKLSKHNKTQTADGQLFKRSLEQSLHWQTIVGQQVKSLRTLSD